MPAIFAFVFFATRDAFSGMDFGLKTERLLFISSPIFHTLQLYWSIIIKLFVPQVQTLNQSHFQRLSWFLIEQVYLLKNLIWFLSIKTFDVSLSNSLNFLVNVNEVVVFVIPYNNSFMSLTYFDLAKFKVGIFTALILVFSQTGLYINKFTHSMLSCT